MNTANGDMLEEGASGPTPWNALLQPYKEPSLPQAVWQLLNTAVPFFLVWALMCALADQAYWLTLLLAVPAAGLQMRLFIIQHDCGHGSFFKSSRMNDALGACIGVLCLTPYRYWRKTHAIHHATSGNLDRRGTGDIDTLTVEEYLQSPAWKRLGYRLYRNPFVLFVLGPALHFVVRHRLPGIAPASWKQERRSILWTDLALAGVLAVMALTIGIEKFLMVQLPITLLSITVGVWFFYVQHQFEGTYWERDGGWEYASAGMQGSSYYKLPKILQWFSGNIGLHHIHHLNSRIPNYNLQRCMDENPIFHKAPTLTLLSSLKSISLRLWDEKEGRLVGYEALRARQGARGTAGAPELHWTNVAFFALTPLVALLGTGWYALRYGVHWLDAANFLLLFGLTELSISAGYHRYYAHRSYECGRPLQLFYLIFGAAAVQHSLLNWASDHRYHHRYVDSEEDPYSIMKGAFYAHIGWIFYRNDRLARERYKNAPDLLKDPLVAWQHRWYAPLALFSAFALPAGIGWLAGRPLGGLLWGGLLRMVVVHHLTFCVNSVAHLFGTQPYTLENSARNNWWLGPLTFGEGYHNFHHAFPADYRIGVRWHQIDAAKWWLRAASFLGLAWDLRRAPEPTILSAKLRVEMRDAERRLAGAGVPAGPWERAVSGLQAGRQRLELAMLRYQEARIEYRRQKALKVEELRLHWRWKLAKAKYEFREAQARWRETLAAVHRIPQPSARGLLTLTALLDLFKGRFPGA